MVKIIDKLNPLEIERKDFGHCCFGAVKHTFVVVSIIMVDEPVVVYLPVYNFVRCCLNRWGIEMLPRRGFSSYPKPIKPPPPSAEFRRSVLRECSCSCLDLFLLPPALASGRTLASFQQFLPNFIAFSRKRMCDSPGIALLWIKVAKFLQLLATIVIRFYNILRFI